MSGAVEDNYCCGVLLQRFDQAINDFGPDRDHTVVHVRKVVHIQDVELADSVDCLLALRSLVLKQRSYLRARVVLAGEHWDDILTKL